MQTVKIGPTCQQIESGQERGAFQGEEDREVWQWPKDYNVTAMKIIDKERVNEGALAGRFHSVERQKIL